MSSNWFRVRDSFDRRQVAHLIGERWGGDPSSVLFISADYNIVFRYERAGRGYYLRICHEVLHPLPEARAVMRFLRYLDSRRVPVGAPIPSLRGQCIERLDGGFFASAQREAPGDLMEAHVDDIGVYEAWGRSLGKLHAASRSYQPDEVSDYEFPTVQRFWKNIAPTIEKASPQLRKVYAELSDWMENLPKYDYGLIHGDYRPGNVLWDGATAWTIDFDEPNFHWYVADICRALLELWGRPLEERREKRKEFMRGYLREHEIDEFWVGQLPFFAQHRAMLMHAWDVQEGGSWDDGRLWALERVGW